MGMYSPDIPAPPDPNVTAGAQTAQNVTTAVANSYLQNQNVQTPYQTTRREIRDWHEVVDPATGAVHNVPEFVTIQELNPKDQQALANTRDAGISLSEAARDQSEMLKNYLSTGIQRQGTEAVRNLPGDAPQTGGFRTTARLNEGPASGGAIQREVGATDAVARGSIERAPIQFQNRSAGAINQNGPQTGAISRDLNPGALDRRGPNGGAVQQNIGSTNSVLRQSADRGPIQSEIGDTNSVLRESIDRGQIQTRGANGGQVQGQIGSTNSVLRNSIDRGPITQSYGTDFSNDRQRVEEALMSRMNPQIERDREALRSSLVAQGVNEGSEAFDRAMNRLDEQSNDARMQAILAGGQEQSRLAGLEAQRASFENQAQQQGFNQTLANYGQMNAAQQQQFDQQAQRAGFVNQAQAQRYAQDAANLERSNAAQQQGFNQSLANYDQLNRAQAQQFDQAERRQQAANNAQNQGFQQTLANYAQLNDAQAQQFDQAERRQQATNAAQAQRYGQAAANIDRNNAVQAQDFAQQQARMQALNDAEAQRYGQDLASRQYGLAAQQQQYDQNMGNMQAANAAQGQNFDQMLANREQLNAAQQQQFAQAAARQQAQNAAQQQAYAQSMGNIELQNAARQAELANYNQGMAQNNQRLDNRFNQQLALANASDQRRQQFINEDFAYRNQPINEITALLSGSQVQQPNLPMSQMPMIPTTDYAGIVGDNYNSQLAAAQMNNSASQGLLGGLFGLGSAGIMGGLFG